MANTGEPWGYLLNVPVGSGGVGLVNQFSPINIGPSSITLQRTARGEARLNGSRIIQHSSSIVLFGREYLFVDAEVDQEKLRIINLDNKFAIGKLLGQGGFGNVYLCFDKKSSAPFALKIANNGSDREKQILSSLNYIHVTTTIFFKMVGTKAYIGMEYMQGGDLSYFIKQGSVGLTESQIKLLFYQIADGVYYLHQHGVCHRDLKPANILLTHANPHTLAKLTDLGISKSEIMHSVMRSQVGTEYFMAPEMKRGNYEKNVDVWSMGVMLYMSLTGSYVTEATLRSSLSKLRSELNVTNLIKSMLEISPSQRVNIAGVLQSNWLQDEIMKRDVIDIRQKYGQGPSPNLVQTLQTTLL